MRKQYSLILKIDISMTQMRQIFLFKFIAYYDEVVMDFKI